VCTAHSGMKGRFLLVDPTPSQTQSCTQTQSPSQTRSPSLTPSQTVTQTQSSSLTRSTSLTATVTPSQAATPSQTPSQSRSPSTTPSATSTPTSTQAQSPSATSSPSQSQTASTTQTSSQTLSQTRTPSPTTSQSASAGSGYSPEFYSGWTSYRDPCNRRLRSLYPFANFTQGGSATGDVVASPGCDDCYYELDFSSPFKFYGNTFSNFTVNSNGAISLGWSDKNYAYKHILPLGTEGASIYVFWADIYTEERLDYDERLNNIYYRSGPPRAADAARATRDVALLFPGEPAFIPTAMAIVTWFGVVSYVEYDAGLGGNRLNTFQV
jgi:hypothetical protein